MRRSLLLTLPFCALLGACTGTVAVETTQPAARAVHDGSKVEPGEDDGNVPGQAAAIEQKDDGNYGGTGETAETQANVQEPIKPPRFQ